MVANTREVIIRFKLEADKGNGEVARQIARQAQAAAGGSGGRAGPGPAGGAADEARFKRMERADAYQYKEAMKRIADREKAEKKAADEAGAAAESRAKRIERADAHQFREATRRIADREKAEKKAADAIERELESSGTAYTRMAQRAQMSSVRMVRNLTWVGDSVLGLTKGIALLGASGEKDMEKLVRSLVKIQAFYDIFRDGAGIVISVTRAWVSYRRAVEQAAAAQAVLASAQAASVAIGGGGAGVGAGVGAGKAALIGGAGGAVGTAAAAKVGMFGKMAGYGRTLMGGAKAVGAGVVGTAGVLLAGAASWGGIIRRTYRDSASQLAEDKASIPGRIGEKIGNALTGDPFAEARARINRDMDERAKLRGVIEAGAPGRAQIRAAEREGAGRRRQYAASEKFFPQRQALIRAGEATEFGLSRAHEAFGLAAGSVDEPGGMARLSAAGAKQQAALAATEQQAWKRAGTAGSEALEGLGIEGKRADLAAAEKHEAEVAKGNAAAIGYAERLAEAKSHVLEATEAIAEAEENARQITLRAGEEALAGTKARIDGLEGQRRAYTAMAEAAKKERESGAAAFGAMSGGQQKRLLRLKDKGLGNLSRKELADMAAAGVEGAKEEQSRRGEAAGFGRLSPDRARREEELRAKAGALEVEIRDAREVHVTLEQDVQGVAQSIVNQLQPLLLEREKRIIEAVQAGIARSEDVMAAPKRVAEAAGQGN